MRNTQRAQGYKKKEKKGHGQPLTLSMLRVGHDIYCAEIG